MLQFDVGSWSDDDLLPGGRLDSGPRMANNDAKKANKNDNSKKSGPVEVDYEGHMLEKLEARPGEKSSWSRVGRRMMPFSNEKFADISRKVREESRMGPMTTYAGLSADQQGVITRLIETRQLEEKDKNAEWVLECVRRYTKAESTWRRTTIVCKKLLVVLKRQDRNITKSGQKITASGPASYQYTEIIDLNQPLPKKKDQNKNSKQKNGDLGHHDVMGMPLSGGMPDPFANLGMGGDFPPPPPPPLQRHDQPQHRQDFGPPQGPPQGLPHGAIHVDHQPLPPHHHQQQPMHYDHHHGPAPFEGHPFQPEPQFNIPEAFDIPPTFDPQRRNSQFQTRNRTPDQRRSRSRERRNSRDSKLDSRVERKVDNIGDRLEQVINKVDTWNIRDNRSSSEDSYRENEYWSGQSGGFSTPPSSPPMSVREPNGTLGGRKSYRRDGERYDSAYPRQQRRYESDVVVEPYTNRDRQHRVSYNEDPRRRDSFNGNGSRPRAINYSRVSRAGRPVLHHSNTWNDYPNAPVAERVQQRALPQYPSEDYDFANYNRGRDRGFEGDRRRSRRESMVSRRDSG